MPQKKKLFSFSNIITAVLILLALGMLMIPGFKATVLQGLMKAGFFQPSITTNPTKSTSEKSWEVLLTSSKGEIIDGNALKGKVVFINAWAIWCPPCIAEMPSINELYKAYRSSGDMVFLTVDADNDLQKSEKFITTKGFDLPVYTSQIAMPAEWYDGTLPTTIVLDKKGNIVYHHKGAANYNSPKFKKFIDMLLQQNTAAKGF